MGNLRNCAGLVFGFVFRGGQGQLVRDETLRAALDGGVWLHLGLSDHRARRFLNDFPDLPETGRALLLGGETRIQILLAQDHAAGVLPDIEKDFDDQSLEPGRLAFWLNGRILLTTRRKPVRAAQAVQEALAAGLCLKDPAAALARLQAAYAEIVEARLVTLGAQLDRIEDKVLADRAALDGLPLGPLRRELSRHHQEFAALRGAIHRAGFARLTGETPLSGHCQPCIRMRKTLNATRARCKIAGVFFMKRSTPASPPPPIPACRRSPSSRHCCCRRPLWRGPSA